MEGNLGDWSGWIVASSTQCTEAEIVQIRKNPVVNLPAFCGRQTDAGFFFPLSMWEIKIGQWLHQLLTTICFVMLNANWQ